MLSMRTTWLVSLVMLAIVMPALSAQATESAPAPRTPKSSSTLITVEDIERVRPSVSNALDAVQLLRPRWLKKTYDRSETAPGVPSDNLYMRAAEVWVIVDGHEMGGLNYLKALPAEQVYTLQFLRVNEVMARYGFENAPAIVVTLR
jgi:hypothetical protein